MNEAYRATSAKERATIAARYIRAGKLDGRAFFSCFEQGDGWAVARHLMARNCPKINAYAERARWAEQLADGATDSRKEVTDA